MSIDFKPSNDGLTHINIYSAGITSIGRDLSNFAKTPFIHPELGRFESVEGLWYWLSRRDERLRDAYGYGAKRVGRELPVVITLEEVEFRRLLKLGLDAKLNEHPEIMDALRASTLPLAHYYAKHGRIDHQDKYAWILAHFEGVRAQANPLADMRNTELVARQSEISAPDKKIESLDQMSLF